MLLALLAGLLMGFSAGEAYRTREIVKNEYFCSVKKNGADSRLKTKRCYDVKEDPYAREIIEPRVNGFPVK